MFEWESSSLQILVPERWAFSLCSIRAAVDKGSGLPQFLERKVASSVHHVDVGGHNLRHMSTLVNDLKIYFRSYLSTQIHCQIPDSALGMVST